MPGGGAVHIAISLLTVGLRLIRTVVKDFLIIALYIASKSFFGCAAPTRVKRDAFFYATLC
jgi:hypothetical protein